MTIKLYQNDLPEDLPFGPSVSIDTEAMGLKPNRDRLCLVQLSFGDGDAHLVQFKSVEGYAKAERLRALLQDPSITKIFHYARFDMAILAHYLGVMPTPAYCTKTVSKIIRTYTDKHGLKDLCKQLLGVEISKQEQTSDWGAELLREDQLKYAASDVLYLHRLKTILDQMVEREGRGLAVTGCLQYLPYRAYLDLLYGDEFDPLSYSSK